ncbi:MAG TPA: AMMECR1 domain-containing protein [Blastocatellia bacterium]|nr:AMMECR1 domain-containing protein [Blastocatellia bacterium]
MRQALSTVLSSLPDQFHSDRRELLELLIHRGILYRTPTQPVLSRDGSSARWMLNSLAVTLTPRGAELAGACLLELLKHFDGKQIATYGLTAVPIVQSCILQSGGRYHGLLVRKERKKHGSLKLIEGPIDPDEPTILIDDSTSSGMSMEEGCKVLEEAGLRVEGGVCLVRFGWYGGYALMQERGYHVEAVYDIWEDFMTNMEGEQVPLRNPSKWFPEFEWSQKRAPERLHPAVLARTVLLEYLTSGELLLPPEKLDGEYDSAGGAWVSIRSKSNIHERHSRDGFWHFPGEERWSAAEDVVRACLRTAHSLPKSTEGIEMIESSHIAVTFFSALEQCTVGQLDNDRYGIVVCSRERPSRMGGALPRMPGIANEWQQFQHARKKNGELISFEPYVIYRHEVVKAVEPEAVWQPSGVPVASQTTWHEDTAVCGPVAERARDIVVAHLFQSEETTSALAADLLPPELDSIYVSIYLHGQLRGCVGSVVRNLDEDVRKLALAALGDERFAVEFSPQEPARVAVSVSFLYNPLNLGQYSPEEVMRPVRHGQQALMVYQGKRVGLLLPFVAVTHNLNPAEFVAELIDKAGITRPPYNWCRFDCATWLADVEGARKLEGGFPPALQSSSLEEMISRLARLHADYLVRQQEEDGSLYLQYEPFQNKLYRGISTPRLAHAAWVMARAHRVLGEPALKDVSSKIIDRLLKAVRDTEHGCWLEAGDDEATVAEVSFLLLALCQLPESDARRAFAGRLSETLWSSINSHGRIITHRPPAADRDPFQDYFPGQVILALGVAHGAGVGSVDEKKLYRAFSYYKHRFRHKRDFGQVSWLMQAFGEWWRVTGEPLFADFVFEIGDWVLEYQQEKTGAFINGHQSDTPGYTTALYLEGIGAAMRIAAALTDAARHKLYVDSFTRGLRFLDRLVIQRRDGSILPNIEFAVGGLRQSLTSSQIRVDFVQHSLSAILEAHACSEESPVAATGATHKSPQ